MAEDLTDNVSGYAKAHPYFVAGIGVAIILVIWLLMRSSSSTSTAATAAPATDTSADAAQLAATQSNNQTQAALATISANAQNSANTAQQTISLAQIQASTDQLASTNASNVSITAANDAASAQIAGYNSSAEIASSNNATAQTALNAQAAVQLSGNSTIASEFADLASVINQYGTNYGAIASNIVGAVNGATTSAQISSTAGIATGSQGSLVPVGSAVDQLLGGTGQVLEPDGSYYYSNSTPGILSTYSQSVANLIVPLETGYNGGSFGAGIQATLPITASDWSGVTSTSASTSQVNAAGSNQTTAVSTPK